METKRCSTCGERKDKDLFARNRAMKDRLQTQCRECGGRYKARAIRISDETYAEIAKHGKFGETPDDVLRRILRIERESELDQTTRITKPKEHSYD